jgi:hypothetical protein
VEHGHLLAFLPTTNPICERTVRNWVAITDNRLGRGVTTYRTKVWERAMRVLNTLTAYVIGVLIVWAAILVVGYFLKGGRWKDIGFWTRRSFFNRAERQSS